MPRWFNTLYLFDLGSKSLQQVPAAKYSSTPESATRPSPMVVASSDGQYAMGVYCRQWPNLDARFPYPWYASDASTQGGNGLGGAPVDLTKWNVVWHAGRPKAAPTRTIPTGDYFFEFLLPVGTVQQVADALAQLVSPS
jgi:hypothetical protein